MRHRAPQPRQVQIAGVVAADGPLTDAQLRADPVEVEGDFYPATQPVSIAALPALAAGSNNIGDVDVASLPALTDKSSATANPIGNVSLGNTLGKENVLLTDELATNDNAADQEILTYEVTAGKTLFLQYVSVQVRLSTFAATATNFGTASLETPSGTKVLTRLMCGVGFSDMGFLELAEPVPIAAGEVVRIVCTPASGTAFTWQANLGGYER